MPQQMWICLISNKLFIKKGILAETPVTGQGLIINKLFIKEIKKAVSKVMTPI